MRQDTALSFIDTPGCNDRELGTLSKKWIADNWSTFDYVIVVLDAQDGFNSTEQSSLIDDVKVLMEVREMPVLFLANKYDDNDKKEWSENVKEIESKIEEAFGESGLQDKLYEFLKARKVGKKEEFPSPAFLPCSAQYALIYLSALCEGFTIDHFKKLPFDIVDSFGYSDVGNKKWRLLKTKEDKYNRAFKELEDRASCELGLEDTNFDKVLSIIDYCVAGREEQAKLICKQLDFEMQSKHQSIKNVVDNLRRIYNKKKVVLGKPAEGITEFFWENYTDFENDAFLKLLGPGDCHELSRLMTLLVNYDKFAAEVNLRSEHCVVAQKMGSLVRRQIQLLIRKANAASCAHVSRASSSRSDESSVCWESITLRDWFNLIDSVLEVSPLHKRAHEEFNKDLRELRFVYQTVHEKANKMKCSATKHAIPDRFEDSNHWGHLLHQYCFYLTKAKSLHASS